MELTRSEFLRKSGQATIALGMAGLPMTEAEAFGRKSLEETLKPENYAKLTKKWDPVYGPELWGPAHYGGRTDFKGHLKDPEGAKTPGVDYDVPVGTPLVPAMAGILTTITRDTNRALIIRLSSINRSRYSIDYVHLDDVTVDNTYIVKLKELKSGQPFRIIGINEIVALSGASGFGSHYGLPFPHLHLNLLLYSEDRNSLEFLDAEKYGLDGGKPVLWDGENIINTTPEQKLTRLEAKLQNFRKETEGWPEELRGKLLEYCNLLGDAKGNAILDNKNFQDMRALLKLCTLETKKYVPGTRPYAMMYAVVGFSMVPPYSNQPATISLPSIAPGVINRYKIPVYEKGIFLQMKNGELTTVKK